ncbi:hypothetical protein P6O83_15930, partial [Clostridium perfringens]|nr:hypothetical protein [Clostridium perfringens]
MEVVILTKSELDAFKEDLKSEFKSLLKAESRPNFLRSKAAREMLGGISYSVLQQLRINGDIPAVQLSTGTWLYPIDG